MSAILHIPPSGVANIQGNPPLAEDQERAHAAVRPAGSAEADAHVLPIIREEMHVGKETIDTAIVRVQKVVRVEPHTQPVSTQVQTAQVTRLPKNEPVDARLPPWREGDVWVVPVYEEVAVVVKQLMLKEELRIALSSSEHRQDVSCELMREDVVVERERLHPAL